MREGGTVHAPSDEEDEETAMNPLKVIEQRCPDRPLWDPILKVMPEKSVAQFMFMGEVLCESGTRIFLYKHIWSRRYINLDQQGQAYQFHASEQGSHYVPVELSGAIRRASSF
ncbi:MAG: hypothetical protein OJF50_000115 [Nitrospira sp.]|jgi:hypothetical protein|nr:hypothetical protein [Nitrospira sp.]